MLPPHYHPNDEAGTVLSGTFYTGMGNRFDKRLGHPLSARSYAFVPNGIRHFAWVEEPTEVQVHGLGPWELIAVDAAGHSKGRPFTLPLRRMRINERVRSRDR